MFRAIKTFIKDPEPVYSLSEVEKGLNIVEGIVRIKEPIRSPVRGQHCAAFFYRSFLVMTEGRAPVIHKLKQAEVYTDFDLELSDGILKVVPSKLCNFEQRDHQVLQKRYGSGFHGIEELVIPGAIVRVRGKVKGDGDSRMMLLKDMIILEKQADGSNLAGNRKKRKRKKK